MTNLNQFYQICKLEQRHKELLNKTKDFFDISSTKNNTFEYYKNIRTGRSDEDELEINLSESKTIVFDNGLLLPNLNIICSDRNINIVFTGIGFVDTRKIRIVGASYASIFFIDCKFKNGELDVQIESSNQSSGLPNGLMFIDCEYQKLNTMQGVEKYTGREFALKYRSDRKVALNVDNENFLPLRLEFEDTYISSAYINNHKASELSLLFKSCSEISEIEITNTTLSNLEIIDSNICVYSRFNDKYGLNLEEILKRKQRFDIYDSDIYSLKIHNTNFYAPISFDSNSTLKSKVDVDNVSMSNLLDSNGCSIEFSRLAEFFNRNNAYMDAQQLHRHYLLAKAKESLNKDSKEDKKTKNKPCFYKKWTGLSGLINLYDLINGCGTSFVKPIICMFFIWIANVVILQYQFIDDGTKVFCHSINNMLPFAGIFTSSEDIKLPFVILALKLTSILATLLWFLIALQIRKLLKLKD
ncbi:hypothetical protein [Francisella philomiragia]|uniref:hypothetical protein n=1 Tax=Francisella philomiragia TaxID=28110 RepID=UPI0022431357|nr:hypothetical protein [Francisella philomiragia]